MLAAMPRLLDALAFSAGYPDPRLPHPAAQRLPRNFEIMTLCQLLGRECRSKVCVTLPHQSDRMIANHIRQAVVRRTPPALFTADPVSVDPLGSCAIGPSVFPVTFLGLFAIRPIPTGLAKR